MPVSYNICAVLFLGAMVYASVVDIRARIIPNGVVAVGIALWAAAVAIEALRASLFDAVAVVGGLAQGAGVSLFALVLAVGMNKVLAKESLGAGDVKLLFPMGLFLGFEGGLLSLGAACVLSLAYCALRFAAHGPVADFPFAPFLVAAYAAVLAVRVFV